MRLYPLPGCFGWTSRADLLVWEMRDRISIPH